RLLLQEGIAEIFRRRLIRRMSTLRVGMPLDKTIDMGAVVAPVQLERIKSMVETGVKEGAEKYQTPGAMPAEGCFYPPTLLWNVHPSSTVATE
ncbi:aldehyde dehydrogenase family protein, partial [Acinetobacter baumannii]